MKKLGLLCLLTILHCSLNGQSTFSGSVYENANCNPDARRNALPDATISADGAVKQVYSRQDGSFTLDFPSKPPGTLVSISINKAGLQSKKVQVKTCTQCTTPNIFVLCPKAGGGGTSALTTNIQQRKDQLAQNQVIMNQSPKNSPEYKRLEKENDQIKKELESNQEELARISAQATEKDWKTISYELQKMLADPNVANSTEKKGAGIDESFYKSLDSLWAANETSGSDTPGADPEAIRKSEIRKYELKALLYSINSQYEKSAQCYRKLLELDNSNFGYLYYAVVFSIQNKPEESIAQLEKSLNANRTESVMRLKCANFLAALYIDSNQPEKAKALLDQNTIAYKGLAKDTAQYAEKQLLDAKLHELYAILFFTANQFDNAIAEYKQCRDIFARLNKQQNDKYIDKIADIDVKLASVFSSIKNYNGALGLYNESLAIYEQLLQNGDDFYLLSKFGVLLEMANLYYTRNDFKTAEDLYNGLSPVFRQLAEKDPDKFQEYYAKILFAEGKMLHDQKTYFLAANKFGEVLNIYNDLEASGKGSFKSHIASALNARGKSLYAQKKMGECKKDYDTALAINTALVKKGGDTYEPSLADSYSLLGSYFLSADKFDSAYYYIDKALKISQKFDAKDQRAYRLSLIQNKQSLASYYFDKKETKLAIKEMDEAYKMAQALVKLDTVVFLPEYATTVLTLAMVYMDEEENDVAISKFKEAFSIFQRLSKEQPEVYELQKATVQYALGTLYSIKAEDKIALQYFEQAILICNKQLQKNKNAYAPLLAQVYLAKANISQKNENYVEELKYLEESEKLLVMVLSSTNLDEYRNQIGNIKIQIAQICIITKEYDRAETAANEGRQYFSDLMQSDPDNINTYRAKLATIENGSGKLNRARGNNSKALDYYRRSEKYYKQLRNVSPPDFLVEECKTKIQIAETQQAMGQDQIAIQELKMVVDTINNILRSKPTYEADFLATLASAYNKLGALYFQNSPKDALDNYAKAAELYKKSEIINKTSYAYETAVISLNTGIIYFNLQRYNEAISHLEQSLKYVQNDPESPNYHSVMIGANRIMGEIFYRADDFDKARLNYSKCLEFEAQLSNYLAPYDILQLKHYAGISNIKSSDTKNNATGEAILRNARTYGNQQNWPADLRPKVIEILQDICNNYIECK